jgi:hypothetical protein
MSNLKDSLNNNSKIVTLAEEDITYLTHLNQYLQTELNAIQQHCAAQFLSYVAITKFGFGDTTNLRFNYQPEKKVDNLTITEVREP